MGNTFVIKRHPFKTEVSPFGTYDISNTSSHKAEAPLLQEQFIGIFFYKAHAFRVNIPVLSHHSFYAGVSVRRLVVSGIGV
jgi:hypothetical protein